MKSYKQYPTKSLGGSDIAALICVGCGPEGLNPFVLRFGGDGSYQAYIVDKDAEIGSHYTCVYTCKAWMKIYDDDGLVFDTNADEIRVYQAGEYGTIIQTIDN